MDNYIFGIKKEDFLNKNFCKVIDGIAGAGKSSIIDNFLKNNNINYLRTTSTNQLKIDAAKRYEIDYNNYSSISSLIFDIESILNETYELDDLEEVSKRLAELNYYNNTNK